MPASDFKPPEARSLINERVQALQKSLQGGRGSLPEDTAQVASILQEFWKLIGRRYTEKQVNEMIEQYHYDFASLLRYLIDEQFLDRKNGQYWLREQ